MGSGELVKAEIKVQDSGPEGTARLNGQSLTVCFNPREYVLTKVAPWVEHQIQGYDSPKYQWTSGAPMQMKVDLFFDAYEEKGDARNVRKMGTDMLHSFTLVDPEVHRPPKLLFVWGTELQFKCYLRNLSIRYTMFLEDGTPVRATASCLFVENTDPAEQRKGKPLHSPDHTKRRVVKQGDTLAWIAAKEYGNPAEWRIIAQANDIDDPRQLTVGRELLIPPLY